MEKVTSPIFSVTYAGKDITADISANLISVTYSDRTKGESDEIEILLEDSSGKWRTDWWPAKGDKLQLSIGYDGNLLDCGTFDIDEIEMAGPPDVLTIRGLAAGINSPLRTKRSQAHENQTLRKTAEVVAERNGLTIEDGTASTTRTRIDFNSERTELTAAAAAARNALSVNARAVYRDTVLAHYVPLLAASDTLTAKGKSAEGTYIRQTVNLWQTMWLNGQVEDINATRQAIITFAARLDEIATSLKDVDTTITRSKLDVKVARATQDRETDLAFLEKIARQYGVMFSVRGNLLIFTSTYDIEQADGILTLDRSQLIRYSMRDKATKTFRKARVSYHLANEKKNIEAEFDSTDLPGVASEVTSGDTLLITHRVESEAQAQEVAKAALYAANSKTAEAEIEVPGRPLMVAGINILLTGLGQMSGKWHISESSHRIDKSGGYVTTATLKRVGK